MRKNVCIALRKIGYIALSIYLLLIVLSTGAPFLLVPSWIMRYLAAIAGLGILIDTLLPSPIPPSS